MKSAATQILFSSTAMSRYLQEVEKTEGFSGNEQINIACFKKRMYFKNTLIKNDGISVECKTDFNVAVSKESLINLNKILNHLKEQPIGAIMNDSNSGLIRLTEALL